MPSFHLENLSQFAGFSRQCLRVTPSLGEWLLKFFSPGLSSLGNLPDNNREPSNANRIRRLLHVQNLCVWVHELLLVADIHCVLQGALLWLPGRWRCAKKRIFQAERWHLRSGGLFVRALYPGECLNASRHNFSRITNEFHCPKTQAINHHDWQTDCE